MLHVYVMTELCSKTVRILSSACYLFRWYTLFCTGASPQSFRLVLPPAIALCSHNLFFLIFFLFVKRGRLLKETLILRRFMITLFRLPKWVLSHLQVKYCGVAYCVRSVENFQSSTILRTARAVGPSCVFALPRRPTFLTWGWENVWLPKRLFLYDDGQSP